MKTRLEELLEKHGILNECPVCKHRPLGLSVAGSIGDDLIVDLECDSDCEDPEVTPCRYSGQVKLVGESKQACAHSQNT